MVTRAGGVEVERGLSEGTTRREISGTGGRAWAGGKVSEREPGRATAGGLFTGPFRGDGEARVLNRRLVWRLLGTANKGPVTPGVGRWSVSAANGGLPPTRPPRVRRAGGPVGPRTG